MRFLSSRSIVAALLTAGLCGACLAQGAPAAATAAAQTATLFQNVRVFDGTSGTVSGPTNVLVRGQAYAFKAARAHSPLFEQRKAVRRHE